MPEYHYRDGKKKLIRLVMSVSEMTSRQNGGSTITHEGKTLARDLPSELRGFRHYPGAWPMKSEALGVMPEQISEARQAASESGVPTNFTPDGRAILTSREHRKKLSQSLGLFDKDAGYGDASPKIAHEKSRTRARRETRRRRSA